MIQQNESERVVSRRRLIGTLGTTAVLGLVPGTTAASGRGKSMTAEEAGVADRLRKLRNQVDHEEFGRVCERYGIAHAHSKRWMPSFDQSAGGTTGGLYSPDPAFKKSDSTLSFFTWLQRTDSQGDEIHVASSVPVIKIDDANVLDDAGPMDGVNLTWSDNFFQPVSQSESNFDAFGTDESLIHYQDYHRYGVWAKVDDNAVQDSDVALDGNVSEIRFGIETEIEKLDDSNQYNVNTEYLHNWVFGGGTVDTFSLGPFGFDFFGTDSWRIEETGKV